MTPRIRFSNINCEKAPIYPLGEQVLRGELALEEALEQVAAESILAQADDISIDQLDDFIRELAEQDLPRATILAVLNCQVAKYKGGDAVWGNCNSTLGWLYLQQDKLELALYHYQEALKTFKPMPQAKGTVAQIRHDIGEIKEHQDEFEAAIDEYQEALALGQNLKLPQLESDARNGLGRVYLALERVDDALVAFQCALELSQKGGDPRGEETALGNLGLANHFLGRLAEAADYHRQAVTLSREIDHQAGTGRHLSGLGNVLIELGELSEAKACFLEALDIARQRHDRRGEQQRLGNLGNLYQAKAERATDRRLRRQLLSKAEQHHQDALAITRERDDWRSQGGHLSNLGNVYSKLGRFEAAQECYKKALALAKEKNVVDTQWRVRYAWGNLCAARRQDQQAFDHYAAAIKVVESQRNQLKIESRTKFWQERATLYKRTVLCCLRLDELWPALEYTERAKARYLADLLAQRAPPTGDTQEIIQTSLKALPPRTAVVIFNVTEVGTIVFVVTNQPNRSGGGALDDDWQQSPDGHIRARLVDSFDRDALQRILVQVDDSGKAVGGYLVDYYADRLLWRESTLEKVGSEIYESLLASAHRELARLQVERIVFIPNLGLSLLPLHACYKVNGTERDYLLDHYEITYAPSFDVLRHCQVKAHLEPRDGLDFFAVANPEKNLVWADVEVERIANLFPKDQDRVLDNGEKDRATRKAVIDEAPNYTYVHFACHGKFNLSEPLLSALSLAPDPNDLSTDKPQPELLTLKVVLMGDTPEINQMAVEALGPLELPRTRMAVMSACETGLVDPGDLADEYVGLPAGFVKAGVPAVVSSLWVVDDLSTALLMERFYVNLLCGDPDEDPNIRSPLLPAGALRRAQQWLRDKVTAKQVCDYLSQAQNKGYIEAHQAIAYRRVYDDLPDDARLFKSPYYWAAFTISGAETIRK